MVCVFFLVRMSNQSTALNLIQTITRALAIFPSLQEVRDAPFWKSFYRNDSRFHQKFLEYLERGAKIEDVREYLWLSRVFFIYFCKALWKNSTFNLLNALWVILLLQFYHTIQLRFLFIQVLNLMIVSSEQNPNKYKISLTNIYIWTFSGRFSIVAFSCTL